MIGIQKPVGKVRKYIFPKRFQDALVSYHCIQSKLYHPLLGHKIDIAIHIPQTLSGFMYYCKVAERSRSLVKLKGTKIEVSSHGLFNTPTSFCHFIYQRVIMIFLLFTLNPQNFAQENNSSIIHLGLLSTQYLADHKLFCSRYIQLLNLNIQYSLLNSYFFMVPLLLKLLNVHNKVI